MSWDLDLIAAVNAYSETSGLSRNVIVDHALRSYLAIQQHQQASTGSEKGPPSLAE
jgi:metal-responsive CopG/Arc/MetJ family transcriptional regulator